MKIFKETKNGVVFEYKGNLVTLTKSSNCDLDDIGGGLYITNL